MNWEIDTLILTRERKDLRHHGGKKDQGEPTFFKNRSFASSTWLHYLALFKIGRTFNTIELGRNKASPCLKRENVN